MSYRAFLTATGVGVAILLLARTGLRRRRQRTHRASRPIDADADPNRIERWLDEAIEETFPASDPPAFAIHTGVNIRPDPYLDR